MPGIEQVRLRDGRAVPFDPSRIVDAILDAMAEAGDGHAELAEELGSAVVHFLESRKEQHDDPHQPSDTDLDEIHDMVEKVLMETGHRSVARAYILRRDRRARIRDRRRSARRDSETDALDVRDRFDRTPSPWSRERISKVLMEEGDLEAADADEIATAVEERVLSSGQRSMTTALIRELVDSELFVRGFTQSLRQQSSVSIPKHDLERLLFRGGDATRGLLPGDAQHSSRVVGDMILRQYVLEYVYGEEQQGAIRRYECHVHQLEHSLLLLRVPLLADKLAVGPDESTFDRLFSTLAELRVSVAEEVEVFGLGEALLAERRRRRDLYEDADDPRRAASALIRGLETFRAAAGASLRTPSITLRIPFSPRLVASAAGGTGGLFGAPTAGTEEEISLFVVETLRHALLDPAGPRCLRGINLKLEVSARTLSDRRFQEALHGVIAGLSGETGLQFCVEGDGSEALAEAELHSALLAGKVTLNLPLYASEARAMVERGEGSYAAPLDAFETLLADRIRIARGALRARDAFVSRLALHPDGPLGKLRAQIAAWEGDGGASPSFGYAIGILGLEETVRTLVGQSLHEDPAARVRGQEIVESIAGLLLATRDESDPEIFLEETVQRGALRRLEVEQRKRFPDTLRDSGRGGTLYTSGVRLSRRAPVDPLEAWTLAESFRPHVRLAHHLDETTRLRSEGPEVLLAFLEEVCRMRATPAPHSEPYRYDPS
ncbi:MAG: anaerobic ribonucleoside-triphosphate reductase [Planctomycetota bacterium]